MLASAARPERLAHQRDEPKLYSARPGLPLRWRHVLNVSAVPLETGFRKLKTHGHDSLPGGHRFWIPIIFRVSGAPVAASL